MSLDLAAALICLSVLLCAAAGYGLRVALIGPVRFARIEARGASAILGRHALRMGYWALDPVVRASAQAGVTADSITVSSLVLAGAAGVALSMGHLGVGGALATVACLGDALDGLVARATKTETPRGAVLDAASDRYGELFIVGGLALHLREGRLTLALALLALFGSFMVSYGSAKAEAVGMAPPRGAMRRAERCACLCCGAVLSPIAGELASRAGLAPWFAEAPALFALALVGVVGNVSAVRRLAIVGRHAAARAPACPPASEAPVVPAATLRANAPGPATGL